MQQHDAGQPQGGSGRLGGRDVLFVMAVSAEYGPALSARIAPLMTGVGPVEAALVTSAALARMADAGRLPDLAICLGSAGSRDLVQGAVYQASSVSYRDMDASALGFARGVTPLSGLPAQLPLMTVPGLPCATLSTGAAVISGPGYDGIDAQMVDMETWAVARACMAHGVPLIGLRGISDGAAPLGGMMDWMRYLDVIDRRLAEALDVVAAGLAG
ncbi:5'-methylthioadenosine/S-adenosylhomocysteine nucleosidase [Paracoccus contaminans]|uniref:5'-methylthioadenosine/S-adenosylhomocysteine nucleosidase n=1 Tax=Paracoccus contaminans TaxID=1945662 RepID=A0A1W6CZC3_9RHOB|nr:5'-methylthioadenosine/S-adenosylhomocysteine nucleosidase [Paracoccus contaminans]ARJ70196.1 5'-methylthioadenosine/S-adenosylhomocysteine nucleosidase [Paracoccus contaminans]